MGAQLNIKSEEVVELAAELAEMEGLSRTQVVLEALRARHRERTREHRIEAALTIARRIRARVSPGALDIDHGELLYDERGLPK